MENIVWAITWCILWEGNRYTIFYGNSKLTIACCLVGIIFSTIEIDGVFTEYSILRFSNQRTLFYICIPDVEGKRSRLIGCDNQIVFLLSCTVDISLDDLVLHLGFTICSCWGVNVGRSALAQSCRRLNGEELLGVGRNSEGIEILTFSSWQCDGCSCFAYGNRDGCFSSLARLVVFHLHLEGAWIICLCSFVDYNIIGTINRSNLCAYIESAFSRLYHCVCFRFSVKLVSVNAQLAALNFFVAGNFEIALLGKCIAEVIFASFGRNGVLAFLQYVWHVKRAFLYIYHFWCDDDNWDRELEVDVVNLPLFGLEFEYLLSVFCYSRNDGTIYCCLVSVLFCLDLQLTVFLCLISGISVDGTSTFVCRVADNLSFAQFDFQRISFCKSFTYILDGFQLQSES